MNDKKRDSWDADLYDQKHSFVSAYGDSLIELLQPAAGEHILDLGCGTGDLTYSLARRGALVTGIDQSANMVSEARRKYPSIQFQAGDAAALELNQAFDAVFSNAVLHWVKTPLPVLTGIYNSLKPGGRFIAEFGGNGNVSTITREVIRQYRELGLSYSDEDFTWYFPTIGEYTSLMEQAGFQVEFAFFFERPTPLEGQNGLTNWLSMFAQPLIGELEAEKAELIIHNTERKLKETLFQDGVWTADYKRLRVKGIKPKKTN